MAERLYQLGFDEAFHVARPTDVTPSGYSGTRSETTRRVGRFVREVPGHIQITSPADAADYLMHEVFTPFEEFDQEELWTLLLDTKNHITHQVMVYRGTVNSVNIRTAELVKEAVRVNAPVLILAHNHPSNDVRPSPEDVRLTRLVSDAADILDIDVLDHLVIGHGQFVSLRERGLGFD